MCKSRFMAGALALMMVVTTATASMASAESMSAATAISAAESATINGEGWLKCAGVVAVGVGIVASGGTGALGLIAGGFTALGYAIELVCECGSYIDGAIGTNFTGACAY